MELRAQYEACGWRLLREIESLPPTHPLSELVLTSPHYKAIVLDDFSDPYWDNGSTQTSETLKELYLFRFDLVQIWAASVTALSPLAPADSRISSFAKELRAAGKLLRSEVNHSLVADARRELLDAVEQGNAEDGGVWCKANRNLERISEVNAVFRHLDTALIANEQALAGAGISVEDAEDLVLERSAAGFLNRLEEKIQDGIKEQTKRGISGIEILQGLSKSKSRQMLGQLDIYEDLKNKDTVTAMIQDLIDDYMPPKPNA